MDLASPISSVIPSAHGTVLGVLARTDSLLSGRQIAALTRGRVGQSRVNEVLRELANAGVVWREERPPSMLYRLDEHHVAVEGIRSLANQWETLVARMREAVIGWQAPAAAAWIFGSAARGDAGPDSDIDVLVVRPDESVNVSVTVGRRWDEPEPWDVQIEVLRVDVLAWSGNQCDVLELTTEELRHAVDRDDRLIRDLLDHGIPLAGRRARAMLRQGSDG